MGGLQGDPFAAGSSPGVDGVADFDLAAIADQRAVVPGLLGAVHDRGARAAGAVLADEAGHLELGASHLFVVFIDSDGEPVSTLFGVVAVLINEVLLSLLHPSHVLGIFGI